MKCLYGGRLLQIDLRRSDIQCDFSTAYRMSRNCVYRLVRRRSLLRFFGISDDRRLRIYIGQINILSGQPSQIDRIPDFHGSAVGFLESTEARRIAELFLFLIPGLQALPTFLSRLFVTDVNVEIEPAPFGPAEPHLDCSYISLGTPLLSRVYRC